MNLKVNLSANEAFLTFSNICVNARSASYQHFLNEAKSKLFDKNAILGQIPYSYPSHLKQIDSFGLDYIDYLLEQLSSNLIDPYSLLRASGVRTLVLLAKQEPIASFIVKIIDEILCQDSLSYNRKLVYYTFLKCMRYPKKPQYPIVDKFFEENKEVVNKLEKEVVKIFLDTEQYRNFK